MKKEDKCSVCGRPYGFINFKVTSKSVERCAECHIEYKKISTDLRTNGKTNFK